MLVFFTNLEATVFIYFENCPLEIKQCVYNTIVFQGIYCHLTSIKLVNLFIIYQLFIHSFYSFEYLLFKDQNGFWN